MLFKYDGAGVSLNPPTPVTETEHGVLAVPSYTGVVGQVTVVVDGALETEYAPGTIVTS
jgi:hypothetical protein